MFTQGNWHVKDDIALDTIIDDKGRTIAKCCYGKEIQTEENALLIAAAPKLLATLKALVIMEDWSIEGVDPDSTIGKAIQAIAEAEGR